MQRRAAAIYVALFVVIGAASYSLLATAETPQIEFQNPEYELSSGQTFQAGSQTYNVTGITAEMEGGGHGGSASLARSGTIKYTNQSADYTASWENNSTVSIDNTTWTVLAPSGENATEFTLREDVNETALLQQDPNAEDELVTVNGTQQVVIQENGTRRLVPANEYFPSPRSQNYSQGATLNYQGNQTTVTAVGGGAVEVSWTAPRTNTIDVSDQGNVTLGDQTYLAYFPNNETMQLTSDFESYNAQTEEIETFHTHENGLWGISILSFLTAVLLVGMAYMPSRY
ncbi:hypothetical protein C474_09517 [Halogeometricum pallidum JCM 14848]|uniref:Uncharacterized protein n=1 Tax=Halogeometricum pallidum JCM 14848 TaxID=1227487 RepID=M0D6S9_HALPD|nr:hypothetical protein [Halogeometricum pallidum]ELZ31206.1 hypothetical protein C474_09517 [Halogeometricum pallidum JCM 14848]